MKNLTKNTQRNNDDIANNYDRFTPEDYPIAYTARKWFFCGLPFYVDENVLVPRFDTEILVEIASSHAPRKDAPVLDLCTGSGCIAVALAKKGFKNITAADISKAALKVARKNARVHKTEIRFVQSDLFAGVEGKFDIIVCNPPYIKTDEIGKYDASILHEPRIALDGGADGLDFYRRIVKEAPLNKDGLLFLEVGDKEQAQEVKSLLQDALFSDTIIIDNRVVYARKTD